MEDTKKKKKERSRNLKENPGYIVCIERRRKRMYGNGRREKDKFPTLMRNSPRFRSPGDATQNVHGEMDSKT